MTESRFADGTRLARDSDVAAVEAEMPLSARLRAGTAWDLIARAGEQWPEHPALIHLENGLPDDPAQTWSYAELARQVKRAANLFHRLGVGPGAVVAYLLPNVPQTYFTMWGGGGAGIAFPVNPVLAPREIAHLLAASGARVLVALGPDPGFDIWEKVEAIRGGLDLAAILTVNPGGVAPEGTIDFDQALALESGSTLASERIIAPGDIAAYFHTGGTTGMPKIARHTQANQVYMAWAQSFHCGYTPADRVLAALPLYHVNATFIAGLSAFSAGSTVVIAGRKGWRSPAMVERFWHLVERHRITFFNAVPTTLASLLQSPHAGVDLSSLRFAASGAAPLSVETHRAFENEFGLRLTEGYGLTEGTCSTCRFPSGSPPRIGSVGLRLPYQRVRIAEVDGSGNVIRDCAQGETGSVLVLGPNVFAGYLDPKANRGVLLADGWLDTGDLGRLDPDGYLYLTGRAKDLIIRSGHNIDPGGIEDALYRHPAVALAAAVGRPDSYAGEIPVAYVTLRPGFRAGRDELLAFARANVAERPAAPADVIILDEMPLTGVGKIFKPALREAITAATVRTELAAHGIPVLEVAAREDRALGRVVTVTLTDPSDLGGEERVRNALGRFALSVEFGGRNVQGAGA